MSRFTWADFEDFENSLHGLHGSYLLRSKPEGDWRTCVLRLPGINLTLAREATGTIYTGKSSPDIFHCLIPLGSHQSTLFDGVRLDSRKLVWLAPNEIFHIARLNSSLWLDIAIDERSVRQWLDDYDDPSMADMISHSCIVSVNDSLALLLGFVREIFQLARAPGSLDFYPSASNFAIASVLALITADRSTEVVSRFAGRRPHILETTLSLIDSCEGALLDTDAICAVAYTTERTIRNVFNDYFRLSPHRYMMLRRLHSIRRTIRDPGCSDNITSICGRHGVWDFGRFAGQYRGCFGLLPSEDLANARRGRMGIVRSPSRVRENSMGLPAKSRLDGTMLRVGRVVVTF